MAKTITMIVDIDAETGHVTVEMDGTQGDECLSHLAAIDRIKGMKCLQTKRIHPGGKTKKVLRTSEEKSS